MLTLSVAAARCQLFLFADEESLVNGTLQQFVHQRRVLIGVWRLSFLPSFFLPTIERRHELGVSSNSASLSEKFEVVIYTDRLGLSLP
jgi:hypothetical protein